MMSPVNKRHWYDGFIYDKILAPNQKGSFNRISDLVKPHSEVLDIGCGTGRFAFSLAGKCRWVTAIDLSDINIRTAEKTLTETSIRNISFIHTSLSEFVKHQNRRFDYSILSYILHEVSLEERVSILTQASAISEYIIVSDHKTKTDAIPGIVRETMEFFAGPDHYVNYRSYIRNDGLNAVLSPAGLKMVHQETYSSHLLITVLQKK